MNTLNNFFEKIYCINLIDEPERKQRSINRFNELGLDVEFVPVVRYPFGDKMIDVKNFKSIYEFGVSLSHYTCIQKAKENKYKNVLILEDDATFLKNINEEWPLYEKVLPNDWDMIYLYSGLYTWTPDHYWIKKSYYRWFTTQYVTGCVSYGLNEKFYDIVIDTFDKQPMIIDDFFCDIMQKQMKYHIYSTVPNLCGHEINYSTLRPDQKEKVNVFSGTIKTFHKNTPNMYI